MRALTRLGSPVDCARYRLYPRGLLAGKALELHQLMEARLSDMQAALERAVRVVRRFDVCAQQFVTSYRILLCRLPATLVG